MINFIDFSLMISNEGLRSASPAAAVSSERQCSRLRPSTGLHERVQQLPVPQKLKAGGCSLLPGLHVSQDCCKHHPTPSPPSLRLPSLRRIQPSWSSSSWSCWRGCSRKPPVAVDPSRVARCWGAAASTASRRKRRRLGRRSVVLRWKSSMRNQ